MADNNPPPPRSGGSAGTFDKVKNGAAVLGAVAGTLTAIYGVYEKVRTEARGYTASSYNTLAPQINQMNDAVKQLQLENQQLRQIVGQYQGKPRIGETPPAAPAPVRRPASGRRPTISARPGAAPAGTPASPSTPQPAGESPPVGTAAGQPTAERPAGEQPAPPASAEETPSPPADGDPVTGLLQTVGRTRQAIESLRKVPEDFEKVVKP